MKTTLKTSARVAHPAPKAGKAQDFSNHHLSVGIDVHKKRWQVAVLCDGICLGNISIEGGCRSFDPPPPRKECAPQQSAAAAFSNY